jgi:histone H3/H4
MPPVQIKRVSRAKYMAMSRNEKRQYMRVLATAQIRAAQMKTKPVFPKSTFKSLVREIAQDFRGSLFYWRPGAFDAIAEAADGYMTAFFEKCDLAREHAGRETVTLADLKLVEAIWPDLAKPK